MDFKSAIPRRDVLAAAATAFTTSLFTGNLKGANDKLTIAFIGLGPWARQPRLRHEGAGFQTVALCDVYQPNLERAQAAARQRRSRAASR